MKNPISLLKQLASPENVFELNSPQMTYKARYIGNTPCMMVKGDGCADKAISNLWFNYTGCRKALGQQVTPPSTLIPNGNDSVKSVADTEDGNGECQAKSPKPDAPGCSTLQADPGDRTLGGKVPPATTFLLSRDRLVSTANRNMPTPGRTKDLDNGAYPRVRLHLSSQGLELRPEPEGLSLKRGKKDRDDGAGGRVFEYKARRIMHATAHTDYPGLFAWVYRHNDGKRNKPECRCHAILLVPSTGLTNHLRARCPGTDNYPSTVQGNFPYDTYDPGDSPSPKATVKSRYLFFSDTKKLGDANDEDESVTLLRWREGGQDTWAEGRSHPFERGDCSETDSEVHTSKPRFYTNALPTKPDTSITVQSFDSSTTLYLYADALSHEVNRMLRTALREYRKERLMRQRHRLFFTTLVEKQKLISQSITMRNVLATDSPDGSTRTPVHHKYDMIPKRKEILIGEMVKVFREKNFHNYNGYRDKFFDSQKRPYPTIYAGLKKSYLSSHPFRSSFKTTTNKPTSLKSLPTSYEMSGDEDVEPHIKEESAQIEIPESHFFTNTGDKSKVPASFLAPEDVDSHRKIPKDLSTIPGIHIITTPPDYEKAVVAHRTYSFPPSNERNAGIGNYLDRVPRNLTYPRYDPYNRCQLSPNRNSLAIAPNLSRYKARTSSSYSIQERTMYINNDIYDALSASCPVEPEFTDDCYATIPPYFTRSLPDLSPTDGTAQGGPWPGWSTSGIGRTDGGSLPFSRWRPFGSSCRGSSGHISNSAGLLSTLSLRKSSARADSATSFDRTRGPVCSDAKVGLEMSAQSYEEDSVLSEESGYIEGAGGSNDASPEPVRLRDYVRTNLSENDLTHGRCGKGACPIFGDGHRPPFHHSWFGPYHLDGSGDDVVPGGGKGRGLVTRL